MNLKSKEGLALLDAMLADKTWTKHHYVFDPIFTQVDVDYVNHMISTEINGEEIIDEYEELLKDEALLEELEIIQRNISRFFV